MKSNRNPRFEFGDKEHGRLFAIRGRKLEIPVFDGTDPDGWILRAERYFNLNRLNDEEKVEVTVISFEGDAIRWYQWESRRKAISRWEEMRSLLLRQFRSTTNGSLCEQFLALKQDGSIAYRQRISNDHSFYSS